MKTIALIALLSLSVLAQTADYTRYVNPFIGTGGHGHTFPGAVLPFGMVQLSPDTRGADWDGSSGYHYSDDVIYGFSHTHLSGTGIPDGCDILLMPAISEYEIPSTELGKKFPVYPSKFDHADEIAEPGYYSVKLDDRKILAELTATTRVGLHRYTFPKSRKAGINFELTWRDKVLGANLKIVGKNGVEGYRRSSSWAKDQIVYFAAEFSKPFTEVAVTDRGEITGAFLTFSTAENEQVLVKVAISSVSIEGARKNLAAELPGWDFDKVRSEAKAAWNKELSKIEVSGGTPDQMTTFYTALYHTMIHPSIFNDVDGNYRGLDGKTHNIADDETRVMSPALRRPPASIPQTTGAAKDAGTTGRNATVKERASTLSSRATSPTSGPPKGGTHNASDQYTVFSLWDTFRAAHPLYTIIDQRRTVDFINTFIRQYEQGGRLPVWELWGNETDTMIGYHAVPVIADAMAKGIKGFDYEKAYEAAKHSAELDHYGLAAYKKRGYISMEDENESVSKTLEYAYDDWCIAQMAKIIGDTRAREIDKRMSMWAVIDDEYVGKLKTDYRVFSRRARYFENLFDPATGFMRPKKNGGFISPFSPNEVTFNYTEGNAWVYSFFAPHDIEMLVHLQGGPQKFATKLDELFTTTDKLTGREQPDITGLIGQYAHGNEPSHHIAYLFAWANQPWKTQRYVRKILDEFYKPAPDGLIGNEDCGQMSAWYVLSASGFYEPAPGLPVYLLGTPLFKEVKFHLENGKTFTVKAPNVSASNYYVRSARLNGKQLAHPELYHSDMMRGGVLEFEMSPVPVEGAFTNFTFPDDATFTAVPIIGDGRHTFQKSMTISMQTITPAAKIDYTLDGSEPTERSRPYENPITINTTTTVKAIAINDKRALSQVAEATYNLIPNDWTVQIFSKYNRQYTGGGDEGLIDGIRGTTSFASGEWQGYQGQDFVAVVDLQRPTEIHELGGGFLQNAGSWIWMPTRIEFELSDDNQTWHKAADIKTDIAPEDMKPQIRDYTQTIAPTRARYVRITARNLGKIPSWHPGSGGDAFIFVDEVIVK